MPYFSQCDPRWGSDQLGGDGPTICSQGCALTSAAMVMAYYGVDTDPKRLNDTIGRGGYDATYCIYWSAVRNACHDEINRIEYDPGKIKPFDETVLNTHLDLGRPVIVYVYCPGHGGYWENHFVVVTGRSDGTYYINDPGFKTISTLDAYPTRHSIHIFSGNPPDINKPLAGDWNGNGTDTTGIYNYTTANFSLDSGLNISFGISGDIPITGDWNGNGYDTIGVFRPSTTQFFLDYDNDGVSDMNATFGVIGDIPVAGDWDGDGDDNIGVFRQNHSDSGLTMFFLDLDNSGGLSDQSVAFGEPDDLPVIGDWDGDGDDNIGLYRPGSTTGVFYLDIDNDGGAADIVTPEYGDLGDIPIAGDWDGDSDDNIGVYRPGTGEFFMDATVPDVSAFDPADWSYSDLITIQDKSGFDLVDYQILIELNTVNFDFSKARSDGADIRFVELDGTLMSYWTEDWNSTDESAKVWVKVPSIPENGVTTIRMWYGNAGATSESNGSAVFEFFDDFDTDTLSNYDIGLRTVPYLEWGTPINPTYDPINKRVNINNGDNRETTLSPKNLNLLNVYAEALFHIDGGYPLGAIGEIAIRRRDANNWYLGSKAGSEYSKTGGGGIACTYASPAIHKIIAGTETYLASPASHSYINLGTEQKIGFGVADNTLNSFINDDLVVQTTDDNVTSSGKIIFSGLQYRGWIDNIRVRQYTSPEPTVNLLQKGDLNDDDQIAPVDVTIALAIAADGSASCDPATLAAADVSGDNRVTSLDVLMILRAVAEKIEL
ncbi:MAG: hypothetical protein C5S48_01975 [Candidatus Methanogaster sp.]|nr:MAG: hypothetical protein C5S48_01975 [ANME-2 cluster archaeon]